MTELQTDVLIVGAGGAGMYAALAAAEVGRKVLLVDKSLVGRGGATIMAQMTVAAAIGQQEPDDWTQHYADTLVAGRGLCHEALATLLCRYGPDRIMELDRWRVGWAREDGHIRQVKAPGHSRERCVYVDFLNSGPAIAATLRRRIAPVPNIHRVSNLAVIDLLVAEGRVVGALAIDAASMQPATIVAPAVILAAGGLTKMYARNSASANMGGDAYAMGLNAGAELVDMEFVQFFPIGHLAPRLVGMDPIMWDPFRYKLGGRLLNGNMEEFLDRYGSPEDGKYTTTRDLATYAIFKEVEAGRGSPHGGAYLDFRHIGAERLREAAGPIIERLAKNGIDLTQRPVEVAPMAHYHMGGLRVSGTMETRVAGLYAAGEAVGGANGANRLSGNALTEALVFGERAGRFAAKAAPSAPKVNDRVWTALVRDSLRSVDALTSPDKRTGEAPATMQEKLQQEMQQRVGPFRTGVGLQRALDQIREWQAQLPTLSISAVSRFNMDILDWFELRCMLEVAETVALAALKRDESRGAHQREDYPETDERWTVNQVIARENGSLQLYNAQVVHTDMNEVPA